MSLKDFKGNVIVMNNVGNLNKTIWEFPKNSGNTFSNKKIAQNFARRMLLWYKFIHNGRLTQYDPVDL